MREDYQSVGALVFLNRLILGAARLRRWSEDVMLALRTTVAAKKCANEESTAIARRWCLKLERGQGGQALRTAVLVQIKTGAHPRAAFS